MRDIALFAGLLVLACAQAQAAAGTDAFAAVLAAPTPAIVRELPADPAGSPGITVRRIVFASTTVQTERGPVQNQVYAVLAAPAGKGPHPGLLILHGGRQAAQQGMAEAWARRGYIAISPDLPGIADPAAASFSEGAWKQRPYGSDRWTVDPAIGNSTIFQALAAGAEAFRLLQHHPDADKARLGIIGVSWGGYATTLLAGLLGDQVKAVYAVWGSAHFDQTVFAAELAKMAPPQRTRWRDALEAGPYLKGIKAVYFSAAASNDRAFHLPAVVATLEGIGARKGLVFGPNADHDPGGYAGGPPQDPAANWTQQETVYFDYELKGQGAPLPAVDATAADTESADISIAGARPLASVELWTSSSALPWQQRRWTRADAARLVRTAPGRYKIDLKGLEPGASFDWYVLAADDRAVSASSIPRRVRR